jgi:hypothetical protein
MTEHAELIADEVLAVDFGPGTAITGSGEHVDAGLDLTFWLVRV